MIQWIQMPLPNVKMPIAAETINAPVYSLYAGYNCWGWQ